VGAALLVVTACSGAVERPTSADTTPPPIQATSTTNAGSSIAEIGDLFGAQFLTEPGSTPTPYEFAFTAAHASCVGRSVVEALFEAFDSGTLMEANVTVEGFESGTADMSFVSNDEIDLYLLDGFIACTDFLEALVAEVGLLSGWSETSTWCYFDGMMANDDARQALAWSTFTIGNLSRIAERVDEATIIDLLFGCLSAKELTAAFTPFFASGLGISEESTSCLLEGLFSDPDSRDVLKSLGNETPGDTVLQLRNHPVVGETTDDLLDGCLANDEKANLSGD
jgi:hypothetical protein